MTLPQRYAASKAILTVHMLAALAQPVAAQDDRGEEGRQPLFSCTTDAVDELGFLNLSAIPSNFDGWTSPKFERTENGTGKLAYSFPPTGVAPETAFLFSHSDGPEGYLVSVRWVDDDASYVYYSLAIPPDPAVEGDMGGGAAGLVISRDGTLVEGVDCVERPYMFISYLQSVMSCDLANPYGEAACHEEAYERSEPLDPAMIGIVP